MKVSVSAVLRLFASLARERMQPVATRDAGRVICEWARALMPREGATDLELPLHRTLVADSAHSERVLAAEPSRATYCAGPAKVDGMNFLAPNGLTIADGEEWRELRAFNEQVLASRAPHPDAQIFLAHVRAAFNAPVHDQNDISRAMGRAMVGIVFGDSAAPFSDPGAEVRELFSVVASVPKRKAVARLYAPRRQRFYAMLRKRWEGVHPTNDATLLTRARAAAGDLDREQLIQQLPHWMFTFTGSASKLLTRTLALVLSRAAVRERVLDELGAAGPLTDASTIDALPYLDACLREGGRLFPPVAATSHSAAPGTGDGPSELIHWFPLLQRADSLGQSTHEFRPERWLRDSRDAPSLASNLFLRGPRSCPGESLVLFVCRAAIARLVGELHQTCRGNRLSRDPLPISFPQNEAVFGVEA
ncbi:MAG: hypothetical protein ABIT38_17695 [Gemmatimonadaceae bacterium]